MKSDYYRLIKSNLKALFTLEKQDVVVITLYSLFIGVFSLVVPIAVSSLVNNLAFGTLLQPIVILALLVTIFLGVNSGFRIVQSYITEMLERRIFARVISDLSEIFPRVQKKDWPSYRTEFSNRVFDVVIVQKSFSDLVTDGIFAILASFIGMVIIAFYHPYFLVFDILVVVIVVFVVSFGFHRVGVETAYSVSKHKYSTIAWLQEVARHHHLFQTEAGRNYSGQRIESELVQYLDARKSHFKIFIRQSAGYYATRVFASALLLGMGGYLVIKAELNIGQFVAAELILTKVLDVLISMPKYIDKWYDLAVSWQKVNRLYSLPVKKDSHSQLASLPQSVESAIRKRQKISMQCPEDGLESLVDSINSFLSLIKTENESVMVLDSNEIFEGTIDENIYLSSKPMPHEEVYLGEVLSVLKLEGWYANLNDEFVSTYAESLDLVDRGRILLLRILLRRPDVLIVNDFFESFNLSNDNSLLLGFMKLFKGALIQIVNYDNPNKLLPGVKKQLPVRKKTKK